VLPERAGVADPVELCDPPRDPLLEEGEEQLRLALVARVHDALGEAGRPRHLVERRGVVSALDEDLAGGIEEAAAVLLRGFGAAHPLWNTHGIQIP
jgi:hypothetical protein